MPLQSNERTPARLAVPSRRRLRPVLLRARRRRSQHPHWRQTRIKFDRLTSIFKPPTAVTMSYGNRLTGITWQLIPKCRSIPATRNSASLHGALAGRRKGQCLIATYVIVRTKEFSGVTCLSIRQLLNQFQGKIGNWRPIIDAERRRRESKYKAAR